MTAKALPVFEALALDIKAAGIEVVFGLMSEDTAALIATLDAIGIAYHAARHENTAIGMAEGYAASSGKTGVVILGRGPGTANSIHGAAYACRSGSKVLMIFGSSPAVVQMNGLGPDGKVFDGLGALTAAGLRPYTVSSKHTARQTLADALASAKQGPTALLVPADIQAASLEGEWEALPQVVQPKTTLPLPRTAALRAATDILARSTRPLILAGLGAHRSGAKHELIALSERLGAALATTVKAKDFFKGHPMDCGILGSFTLGGGRRLIEQADCVIAFGAGLNQHTSSRGSALPHGIPLIQVDIDRTHIGRWLDADVAITADAKATASRLLEILPERAEADKEFSQPANKNWLRDFKPEDEFVAAHTPRTVDVRSAGIALDRMLPADRNVVYDAGNFLQVLPFISVKDPSRHKQASDFFSIGLGFGVALGYARSTPERTTVFIVGDGAFLMTLGELETVVRESIPLVIVVMNDCAYGAELHYLKLRNLPVGMSQFADVDFAPIAEAFGFRVATVRTMAELESLRPILSNPDGPILIDCKINAAIAAPFMLPPSQ